VNSEVQDFWQRALQALRKRLPNLALNIKPLRSSMQQLAKTLVGCAWQIYGMTICTASLGEISTEVASGEGYNPLLTVDQPVHDGRSHRAGLTFACPRLFGTP
jgi:hypothetical protein